MLFRSWTWNFGNGSTSTTPNASQIFGANGTYFVRLVTSGPCGADTASVNLHIDCIIIGIAAPRQLGITVFPNPNDGLFKIHFDGLDQNCGLTIMNQLGQSIYKKEIKACNGQCDEWVDIQGVAAGVYFAKMEIGILTISKRIVVR